MQIRTLDCVGPGPAVPAHHDHPLDETIRWRWIDIETGGPETAEMVELTTELGLDMLDVRNAVDDRDLPKVDDLGHSLLIILHGLAEHSVVTYQVTGFLSARTLVTVHRAPSPAITALWTESQHRPELTSGGADELLARLADVLTRRLISVLDVFDERIEELIERALDADHDLLREVTQVRRDVATVRRSALPQREALDVVRRSNSPLLTSAGHRRFSDAFDVAARAVAGTDSARTALTETLDAYRGAEAKSATDVTKVLTVYAAIMLPLSLVVGFFGMNVPDLPGSANESAWIIILVGMIIGTVVSLGMFVSLGWVRRLSGRQAGSLLAKGLAEGARAPAQLAGAAFEISLSPLRTIAGIGRDHEPEERPDRRS